MDIFEEMSMEVLACADACVDIPLIDFIMESDDPATTQAMQKNAEMGDKSIGIFRKMANFIRGIFKRVSDGIKDLLEYFNASKEEKLSFEQMCRELQSDPEFKGKKLTFHDYRDICKEMDDTLKEQEAEYIKFKESQAEENPNLINTISKKMEDLGIKCKEVAQAEAASFSVEVAIKYAQQSKSHAAIVKRMLDFDMGLLAGIEKEIGEAEMRKFKKKIKKLNSRFKIIRLIAGGREKQEKTLRDAITESTQSMWSLWRTHRRASKGEHGKEVKDATKSMIKIGLWARGKKKAGERGAKDMLADLKTNTKGKEASAKDWGKADERMDKQINQVRESIQRNRDKIKAAQNNS